MAFQVSPGVQVREVDLTNIVPAVASTNAGFAGYFGWGPIEEVFTVSDLQELVEYFGEPGTSLAASSDFFTCESFLKYGSSLRIVRIENTGVQNAAANGVGTLIKNSDSYESSFKDGQQAASEWVARFAGARGNSIGVQICASSDAFKKEAATTVTDDNAIGDRSVTLSSTVGVQDGSILQFTGHSTRYRITDLTGSVATIQQIGAPLGTGLKVAVNGDSSPVDTTVFWQFFDQFPSAPGTSASASLNNGEADELHIIVYDTDGTITGQKDTILEKYAAVSCASDAKDSSGQSNYYKNVIERRSEWVYWTGHNSDIFTGGSLTTAGDFTHASGETFVRVATVITKTLSAGADGSAPTVGEIVNTWDLTFANESTDISFLIANGVEATILDWTTLTNEGIRVCENRRDCVLVVSPLKDDVVDVQSESSQTANVVGTFETASSSSYAVFDSTWVYQYDRFNDRYIWAPASGHTAGIMVRSDLQRDPWYSPAGLSRGQYLGITKLAYNPGQTSRDDLYRARINPVVTFPGQGTILYGDKTALTTPSAFDRINVRRLFIVLEKAISVAAKAQLFEFNDAFTRAQFRSAVEPFLRDVQNRRGLIDFAVLCDETNNTDSVIDRNEFICSIFVKPARSINFITLNFVAARTGVEFEEIYSAV